MPPFQRSMAHYLASIRIVLQPAAVIILGYRDRQPAEPFPNRGCLSSQGRLPKIEAGLWSLGAINALNR